MDHPGELARLVHELARGEGLTTTAWPGLTAWRRSTPSSRSPAVYAPCLCVVAQGRKVAYLGDETIEGNPGRYLVTSLSLPIENQVLDASPERPLLGIAIDLDATVIGKLVLDMEPHLVWPEKPDLATAAVAGEMTPRLDDVLVRFLRAVQSPVEREVLARSFERELLFEVLRGPCGPILRDFVLRDGSAYRVAQAVSFIERQFREPLEIDAIAAHVGMSSSSLHEHFKKATSLSPIQYAKRRRLHEARSLLFAGRNASEAAFEVGYSSSSQFSREFRRMFGVPPSKATLAPSEIA